MWTILFVQNPPRKMGPRQCFVPHAVRAVIPSKSVRPASASGIATRIVRTNTTGSIGRSARPSRRSLLNVEAGWILATSWILGLSGNYPRERNVQFACIRFPSVQSYGVTSLAAARHFAAVATFSTGRRAKKWPLRGARDLWSVRVLSAERRCRNPSRRNWSG